MQLFLSIIGVCSVIGSINAASIASRTGTKPVYETANFDDLANSNPGVALVVKTPYKHLKYSAFVYGTPLKVSIQPFSGKSLAIAPYILSGSPTEPPEITISYHTSKVTSFDMKSLAHACATATQQGMVVPALRCKILYTGTKVSGDKVTFEATFNPDGLLDIGDISLFKVKLQEIAFPPRFRGLKSFTFTVLEPPEPGLVQVRFDDVKYTAHVKE